VIEAMGPDPDQSHPVSKIISWICPVHFWLDCMISILDMISCAKIDIVVIGLLTIVKQVKPIT